MNLTIMQTPQLAPLTISFEAARAEALESEMLVQRLSFGLEQFSTKISHLEHLRANAILTGVNSLESAIHVAHIADSCAQGTNLNANVNIAPGLESYGMDNKDQMSFGEHQLAAIDASLEAADSGFMAMVRKIGAAIRDMLSKVFNVFRSSEKRIERVKSKIKDGVKEGEIEVSQKVELGFDQVKFRNLDSIYADMNQKADMAHGQFKALAEKLESKVSDLKKSDSDKDKLDNDAVLAAVKDSLVNMLNHIGGVYNITDLGKSANLNHTYDAIPSSKTVSVVTKESVDGQTGGAIKSALGNIKVSLEDKDTKGLTGKIKALNADSINALLAVAGKASSYDFKKGDVFTAAEKVIDNTKNAIGKYLSPSVADRVTSSLMLACYRLITGIYSNCASLIKESVETHLKVAELCVGGSSSSDEDEKKK